jgi:hypothetical protein
LRRISRLDGDRRQRRRLTAASQLECCGWTAVSLKCNPWGVVDEPLVPPNPGCRDQRNLVHWGPRSGRHVEYAERIDRHISERYPRLRTCVRRVLIDVLFQPVGELRIGGQSPHGPSARRPRHLHEGAA